MPDTQIVAAAVADIFGASAVALGETSLEPGPKNLLWSTVNILHSANGRTLRALDDNEQAKKCRQREQDGPRLRSDGPKRLTSEGMMLIERRNTVKFFRDQAADQFERHTHSAWRPRAGSMVNHRTLTSAMIALFR